MIVCIFGSQLFQALGKMEGILGGAYHHGSVLLSLWQVLAPVCRKNANG